MTVSEETLEVMFFGGLQTEELEGPRTDAVEQGGAIGRSPSTGQSTKAVPVHRLGDGSSSDVFAMVSSIFFSCSDMRVSGRGMLCTDCKAL